MIGMVRAMAFDIADGRTNVRVNAIAPGFIETELARAIAAQEPDPEAAMRTRRAMHAIPRAGQPEEIGEAAAYLATLDRGIRCGDLAARYDESRGHLKVEATRRTDHSLPILIKTAAIFQSRS
jgi:NAD(P)-dependent dehydrogenase (short-subunit alcohol dehydrogenase family)